MRSFAIGLFALAIVSSSPASGAADDKAAAVLAAARKAIGDKKLEALKTLSVEASLQRNFNEMQMTADVEIALELPDKYVRTDQSNGPMPAMAVGFNGDKPIRPANATSMAGGAMIIRLGPGGPMPSGEKPSPEEQERIDKQLLRSARVDASRLMLGWFAAALPSLGVTYSYAGEAESPDGKADVIDAKSADGFAARLFVDRESHLPLMVTYQGPQPRMVTAGGPPMRGGGNVQITRDVGEADGKGARDAAEKQLRELQQQPPKLVEFTLFFDDWRDVGGVKFPHKMRRATAGATNEEWTVTKVKVNPRLDQKKFEG